ncbi:cell division protein FtsQ/DivIB [Streptomyces sp. NPDC058045]|uniref:cell division protein FtsQ/DivIB n=1 Tax=Streptomyces sp. NPDC058045 TaxID=3346311 RepID=UPI0036EF1933
MAGPMTARRSERRPPKSGPPRPDRSPRPHRRRRLLVLTPLLLALLAGPALWVLYGSSWLRTTRVQVTGTEVLTQAQVRDAARVPVGSPLVSVDTSAVAARLKKALPRVDSVDVSRSWPHDISLRVTERHAVAVLARGGRFAEVDRGGVRFATLARPPRGLPRIELRAADSPSRSRFGTGRLLRSAVAVVDDLPAAVHRDTRKVTVRSFDSVVLELTRSRTVNWGSGEESAAKSRVLSALMKAAPHSRHFDVSVPTAPASSAS